MSYFIVGFSLLTVVIYALWYWNTISDLSEVNPLLADLFVEEKKDPSHFSHQRIEQLLQKFVHNGRVDYSSWFSDSQSLELLDCYLASVSKYSPENSPEKFKTYNEKLIYWVHAYNAVVIKSILDNWPLSSVTDLKAPIEIIKGLGFFYKRKFIYGGRAYSLYHIENAKIFDTKSDPRIHFILNCGSEGCPMLRPQLPTGEELEFFLAKAAGEFVADSKNLHIADLEKVIYLSHIFKWYKSYFVNHSPDKTILGYVLLIADDSLKERLTKSNDYAIKYTNYDWSINDTSLKDGAEKNIPL